MESEVKTIQYKGIDISLEFGYKEVLTDFKKMGLDLLAIFEDDSVLATIMINDRVMINVWHYFVKDHAGPLDQAVEQLTPQAMHNFKEAFWQQVVNFTQPQMRPLLKAMKVKASQRLKSPEEILESSSSDSLEKQE